jgi:mannosyl-3-phosphoglycerate phosphatase
MIIVVTDLDGCLLDPATYDYNEAVEPLYSLLEMGVEVAFNSSKTRVEQEFYREKWNVNNIFAVENGAAVYIPSGNSYDIHIIGVSRETIEEKIKDIISETRGSLLWLDSITPEIFAEWMKIPIEVAGLALMREYSTLFLPFPNRRVVEETVKKLEIRGFKVQTGSGRVYVVTGKHDKSSALRIIREYYDKRWSRNVYIGVGDGYNDLPMLLNTDYAVVLGNRGVADKINSTGKKYVFIDERGPKAWLKGILETIRRNNLEQYIGK